MIHISYNMFSQIIPPPAIEWSKNYGGTFPDMHASLELTSDGGYVIAGGAKSSDGNATANFGLSDFWIVKTNSGGNLQWQKSYGGPENDIAYSIQQTSDGGYIVAGETKSNSGQVSGNYGEKDFWVIKINASGDLQWQKNFGGSNDDIAKYVRQTKDGGYIVIGSTSSNNGDVVSGNRGMTDVWLLKLDPSGNLQWEKTYGGSHIDMGNSIELTADGGYIFAATSKSTNDQITGNHGDSDYWIVKINSSGIIEWQKSLGGTGSDEGYSVKQTTDGGYIVLGGSRSNNGDVTGNHGNYDYWLVKLDVSGNIQWQKSHGGALYDHGRSVSQTSDGGYILAGYAMPLDMEGVTPIGSNDYLVIKTDASGEAKWQRTFGGLTDDYALTAKQTFDGGYIICGYSAAVNNSPANYDYWVIKLLSSQLSTAENNINNIKLYPNPAKNFVNIENLPNNVTLSITDASGRKIFNQQYSDKKISVNTSELINGTYILHIEHHGKSVLTKKLQISK